VSFAAVGGRAAEITARHDLDSELGEASPLAAIEAAAGSVLLLGVGYDRCTAFHLAEYRRNGPLPRREQSCPMLTATGRRWVSYSGVALDASDFTRLGADLERDTGSVVIGQVGEAAARLLPVRAAVAYAQRWQAVHRAP
jgi:aminoglycoside 3-N-acetyltransferase